MPTISIIVPVYNAEACLHKCVDSILSQEADLELILVNDGSTDNSASICDEYAKRDDRVRVIHQENQGSGAARNVGNRVAQGKYIMYCDSDDAYDPVQLKRIVNHLDKAEADLLCFNFRNVWQGIAGESSKYPAANISFKKIAEKLMFYSSRAAHSSFGYAQWDKVFRRDIINFYQIKLPERDILGNKDDWSEDLIFCLQYCICVKNIEILEPAVYLLSKRGTPDDQGCQSERSCGNRISHMVKMMTFLYDSFAVSSEDLIKKNFYQIFLWHLKNYIYLDIQKNGIQELRKTILEDSNKAFIFRNLRKALHNKQVFRSRWSNREAKEYYSIVSYLLNGNFLSYKLRNYWIWKVENA